MGQEKRKNTVRSKAWSCSELKDGQKQLVDIKKESTDDLAEKIQDRPISICNVSSKKRVPATAHEEHEALLAKLKATEAGLWALVGAGLSAGTLRTIRTSCMPVSFYIGIYQSYSGSI